MSSVDLHGKCVIEVLSAHCHQVTETLMNLPTIKELDLNSFEVVDTTNNGFRKVGRFVETPSVKAMRPVFGVLCRTAPRAASHVVYALLTRPPRATERPWQKQLRKDAKERWTVTIGKKRVNVYAWGRGPTVLMVHGWGAGAVHMGKMIEPIVNAGFRVVSFDALGHGQSSGRSTDLMEFASSIVKVWRQIGEVHTVLAHSFGVAMTLWAQRDWGVNAGQQILFSSFNHCKWFTEEFGRLMNVSTDVMEMGREMMEIRYNMRIDWNRLSVVEMLRNSSTPTLLVHDRHDEEVPFAHCIELARVKPDSRLHITTGKGHHRLLGDQAVINSVIQYLREHNNSNEKMTPIHQN